MTKEDKKNILYTCSDCGEETYFKIKSQEKENIFSNFVYVWFKEEDIVEKMWVQITEGTQKSGVGKLNNVPTLLKNKKLDDKIVYHTDPDGITREV